MALTKSLSFSYGRKRILFTDDVCNYDQLSDEFESSKRQCLKKEDEVGIKFTNSWSSSMLETLPQEILIKVICGVDHDDLKQLFKVSKTVRDATLIAKEWHFAYSTPSKTRAFRNSIESLDFDADFEAPNAPKQSRSRNRHQISRKSVESVAIALFADDDQSPKQPRRSLFMVIDD